MRILYFDIDTLRPDHLSCYGYLRETSPNIDRICQNAVRFDNCYASDAPCLPSRSACWTGRFGIHTGVVNHGGANADPFPEGPDRFFLQRADRMGLAAVMRLHGMHTVSFSPFAERHAAWWFYAGFREMYNTGKIGFERADEVVPFAIDWLDRNAGRDNWFLHVNVWDSHTTYRTPMEYGEPFENQEPPVFPSEEQILHHWNSYGPHSARETNGYTSDEKKAFPRDLPCIENRQDLVKWINGYDTGIRYADEWFGKIISKLKEQGIFDDTMIIITADHGENQGELGVYGDHHTADRITCRVPYILKVPGVTDGGRVDQALHYQADLSATVLEFLGYNVPPLWDGVSFAESFKTGGTEGRSELIISNNAWACQRSVVWDKWLAIRTYHTGFKAFPEYMLFDLEADPHETANLAREHPDVLQEGMRKLEKWTADMLRSSEQTVDPLWTVISEGGSFHANENSPVFAAYLERLRQTDRSFYADWLEENKGRPIPAGSPWAAALEPGQEFLKKPYNP
ncbi:MAG: sulfatase [Deltaproteobacteria bacterium]|nr:sulfatase [Deltaproteobacteria bacterium]